MKIVVLSFTRNFHNYENKSFINAALKHGVNLKLVDPQKCVIKINGSQTDIYYEEQLLENIDYVLIRVGCMINRHVRHVIEAFKNNQVPVSIETNDISMLADKFATHLMLSKINVNSVPSMKVKKLEDYNLKYPVIFKSNTGSLGIGIYKANNQHELENLVEHSRLLDKSYDFIIQDYIEESFGKDLRVYVVDKKIVGVMKRKSDGIDFRSNYSLHSNAEQYVVDNKIEEIVNKICTEIKSDIIGIDLLFTNNDYLVCEINSAPGFKGFEDTFAQIKVGELIIKTIKNKYKQK